MYRTIKKILSYFIPKGSLFKYEPNLRAVLAIPYSGNKYRCNICGKNLRKFIELSNGNRICPKCGSSDRDRKLWQLVHEEHLKSGISILDFSPSRSLFRAFKNISNINYTSTDLSGDFISDKAYDITNIDETSNQFDLILCYHVLEHVEEDLNAMQELYRVLKTSGTCLIQTPYKEGEIYENADISTEEGRLKHFGQEDHVRIYSVKGLKHRLEKSRFKVKEMTTSEHPENRHGFKTRETILICSK